MMASKLRADGYMTGMLGVYVAAAELVRLGFIVSVTSRSARGADLLVTDRGCIKTWSVQVKTNSSTSKWWALNPHAKQMRSSTHVYIFVSIPKNREYQPKFYVVPSRIVAATFKKFERPNSTWFAYERQDKYKDNWKLFGNP
jgi:hypothetical protein